MERGLNFLAEDLIGILLATLLFGPVLLAPGYVLAWLTDLRGFRREAPVWRMLWSLPLSAFAMPMLAFLIGVSLGMPVLFGVYAALTAATIYVASVGKRPPLPDKAPRWLWISGAIWLAVTVASGVDLPWDDRLYAPVLIYDHNLRAALIDGISRQGLPAVNGLFHPGHDVLLRYHYLWFIPVSLVEQLGGAWVTPRHALLASAVWCGWSLIAVALLFIRYFLNKPALGRLGLWTTTLLTAAGLDIVPAFIGALAFVLSGKGWLAPSAEWGSNTVTSLPHAVLFETHHIASALACCLGFLLLQKRSRTGGSVALAALCFASAPGLSIYVAFAFAAAAVAIMASAVYRRDFVSARAWLIAGAGASILCLPYLLVLMKAQGSGGGFAHFEVRQFFGRLDLSPLAASLVNLAALPMHYCIEAGIAAIAAVLFWKRYRRHRDLLLLAAVPMLIASFLRSGVIANNDLGWRAPLIAQVVVLTVFAGPLLAILTRVKLRRFAWHGVVRAAVFLGFLGTLWDFAIMRTYIPLVDHAAAPAVKWLEPQPGRRNHDLRLVYESLAATLPRNAVVQGNPRVWDQMYLGAYSQRQSGSFAAECGATMGGDPEACRAMQAQLLPVFNDASGGGDLAGVCRAWGIDVLVVVQDDPLWAHRPSNPLVRTPFAEAFACGGAGPAVARRAGAE